ncbi:hypothetical protein PAHAL_3G137700 [Panicum hallii]|uniref:Uncharacterized protein n=1 Tax=Panicum hallii TaxID=206008 RepID=A0A2T8KI39_9POAL|nr:hypothetical protein PAHAL_3G137700 [Panicum hallii]
MAAGCCCCRRRCPKMLHGSPVVYRTRINHCWCNPMTYWCESEVSGGIPRKDAGAVWVFGRCSAGVPGTCSAEFPIGVPSAGARAWVPALHRAADERAVDCMLSKTGQAARCDGSMIWYGHLAEQIDRPTTTNSCHKQLRIGGVAHCNSELCHYPWIWMNDAWVLNVGGTGRQCCFAELGLSPTSRRALLRSICNGLHVQEWVDALVNMCSLS